MPNHGDYDPAKGWYSAGQRGWVNSPDKIGTHIPAPKMHEDQREELRNWSRRAFKPQEQMERLITLRDSDRADDRAKFERIAKGGTRITLRDYEAAKAKAEGEVA